MSENCPRVEIQNIDKLGLSFTKNGVKISFEVAAPGPDILRLVHYKLSGLTLNVIIESPQAEMDLKIQTVNLKTGEVTP